VCQACTEIDADRYIDYIELDAASNRSIDEIRDLIERAAYKPGVGRFKVFMIDEAHQLTKDAFNALLKTLEEPPEYLKFVLATTDPEKMLPTVLSRCLQFNLRPMAPETVREHLAAGAAGRGRAGRPGALRLLARAARGSMRDALSLTDQAIAYGGGRLDEAVVRAMLGSVDRGHAAGLVQALAARDGAAVLDGGGRAARPRPVGRRHAGRDGHAAAADGRGAGRARRAGRRRPRHAGARAWRRCCRRRDPAAVQHGAARPRRAGA
jgi:DNA polymerase-3 subunit gamma/tau